MTRLLAYETSPSNPRDGIRIIRDERLALHVAAERVARLERSKRHVPQCWTEEAERELAEARSHLETVSTEAERVLGMWG